MCEMERNLGSEHLNSKRCRESRNCKQRWVRLGSVYARESARFRSGSRILLQLGHEIAVSTRLEDVFAAASRSDTQPRFVRSSATERQMMQNDAIIGTAR